MILDRAIVEDRIDRYLDGETLASIAADHGVTASSVLKSIQRALTVERDRRPVYIWRHQVDLIEMLQEEYSELAGIKEAWEEAR
jgi:hypothetical protein